MESNTVLDTAPDAPPPAEPTVIWVDFFDSVSYLIDQAPDDKPIELMMLSFEALADPGLTEKLDDNSYTIVTDGDAEADKIVVDVGPATSEFGVSAAELGARTQAVTLDKGTDAE